MQPQIINIPCLSFLAASARHHIKGYDQGPPGLYFPFEGPQSPPEPILIVYIREGDDKPNIRRNDFSFWSKLRK